MGLGLEVMKPGMLTSVQDLGRSGFQQFGIPVGGAMDRFALRVGNLLVGNPQGEAGLEITVIGPQLRALRDMVVAITGADLTPEVDGETVLMWKSFQLKEGSVLSFGKRKQGCRAYLAVAGGIEVPQVMGSKSTLLKGKIGGFQGRALLKNDIIPVGHGVRSAQKDNAGAGPCLPREMVPQYGEEALLRVVLGPQEEYFTPEAVEAFLTKTYTVTPRSDRMGCCLEGPLLAHKRGADIVSDAVPFGGVQVPAAGQPIILMADRQTTGGYTKLGTIISADLPRVAQLFPGDLVRFRAVSVEEAGLVARREEEIINELKRICQFFVE